MPLDLEWPVGPPAFGPKEALIESRFIVCAGAAALLVLSPGVSMAVVTRNAIGGGVERSALAAVHMALVVVAVRFVFAGG